MWSAKSITNVAINGDSIAVDVSVDVINIVAISIVAISVVVISVVTTLVSVVTVFGCDYIGVINP